MSPVMGGGALRVRLGALLLAAIIPLLTGCQSMAPRSACLSCANGVLSVNATQEAYACMGRIAANPRYGKVASHQPLDGSEPTAAQLADTAIPTADEAQLLADIRKEVAACRETTIASYAQILPEVVPAALQAYRDSDRVMNELIQRKIGWGEGNKKRLAIRQGLAAEAARIQAGGAN